MQNQKQNQNQKPNQKPNRKQNRKQKGNMDMDLNMNMDKEPDAASELQALNARLTKLEHALEEKDSELRELLIQSSEVIQQLNLLQELVDTHNFDFYDTSQVHTVNKYKNHRTDEKKQVTEKDDIGLSKKGNKNSASKQNKQDKQDKQDKQGKQGKQGKKGWKDTVKVELIEPKSFDKLAFTGKDKYSYRERMILMNRIDIYRLYVTVIIISSKMKYPRALTIVEERELKMFIEELSELENMILDQQLDANAIWDQGKVCEKQILGLFNTFFNQ